MNEVKALQAVLSDYHEQPISYWPIMVAIANRQSHYWRRIALATEQELVAERQLHDMDDAKLRELELIIHTHLYPDL